MKYIKFENQIQGREIEFKGKNKNDEWLFGDVIWCTNDEYSFAVIIPNDGDLKDIIQPREKYSDPVMFSPEYCIFDYYYICQFVNKLDSNSNKIYEKDVIEIDFNNTKHKYIVEIIDGILEPFCSLKNDYVKNISIIGNIVDNPELLKVI